MKNFDKELLGRIKSNALDLYSSFNESETWVEDNLKFEEKDNFSVKIKRTRAEINQVAKSIEAKPVFAIFGLSQVGKSYLVQNILSVNAQPLKLQIGGKKIEFIGDINPVGGGESTGLVSRFTIDPPTGSHEFPVRAKLFSAKDIVIILADAFFSDVDKIEEYSSPEKFKERIATLKKEYTGKTSVQSAFTEDDVWSMAKYFRQNFNTYIQYVKEIETAGFWLEIGKIIHAIPCKEWSKVFELIWNSDRELTRVFETLLLTLEKANFSSIIHLTENSILREGGAILDVETLKKMLSDSALIPIQLENNAIVEVPISKLSALLAEVTLGIPSEIADDKPFLRNTDLLDFPGARSRENYDSDDIHEVVAVKMFLRGKVSFLFNSYSSGFEINNLLFCMKDEKSEVNTISDLLHEWILRNVGETDAEREKNIGNLPTSPLFVIFTFFNRQLSFDSVKDVKDVSYKWDNRFRKFFEDEITFKYGWHKKWTISKPNFSNFYLLRNFQYSQDTFTSIGGVETEINENRKQHWNTLKETFLNDPFVKLHFDDASDSWDQAALPGKDGSDQIIKALLPAANNFVKTTNFSGILDDLRTDLILNLEKHLVVDDLNLKREKAFQLGRDIEFELLKLFQVPTFSFTAFLKKMSLNQVDVYNLIHQNYVQTQSRKDPENYVIFRSMFPDISQEKSMNENLSVIANQLRLSSIDNAKEYLKEKGIDLKVATENRIFTSASKLVDMVMDHWKSNLDLKEFNNYIEEGLDKSFLNYLIANLLETFDRLNVRDELISLFEKKTKLIHAPSDTEEYLASIITEYINDFVSNFGFNFMKDDRIDEVTKIARIFNQDLSLLFRDSNENKQKVLVDIYDKMDTIHNLPPPLINNFRLFVLKMKLAMLSNCGFVNYNVEENEKLRLLLEKLKNMNFKLN